MVENRGRMSAAAESSEAATEGEEVLKLKEKVCLFVCFSMLL